MSTPTRHPRPSPVIDDRPAEDMAQRRPRMEGMLRRIEGLAREQGVTPRFEYELFELRAMLEEALLHGRAASVERFERAARELYGRIRGAAAGARVGR